MVSETVIYNSAIYGVMDLLNSNSAATASGTTHNSANGPIVCNRPALLSKMRGEAFSTKTLIIAGFFQDFVSCILKRGTHYT